MAGAIAKGRREGPKGSGGMRLWRYNYKILLGTGYWILVLPIAVSQIVTLWMMALAADFSVEGATRIAELMAPLLAAFLAAHTLAPEYKSGVGAVLASKPLSLFRVLAVRVTLALIGGLLLTAVSLYICTTLGKQLDVPPMLVAAIPGVWFLSLIALTFATLFRNALGGFAVAAGIWTLDWVVGYAVHPILSLQGYTAHISKDALESMWVTSKIALGAGGVLLLLVHGKLLPRICRPAQKADLARVLVVTLVVTFLYMVSGASMMLFYAHSHRANLPQGDVTWLRQQLRPYGAIPIARVFGPAFADYVADPPAVRPGVSPAKVRVESLKRALGRYPNSIWADGIAFAIGWDNEKVDASQSVDDYLLVADRFGSSPFAVKALTSVLRIENAPVPPAKRLLAARKLIQDYPTYPECEKAAAYLLSQYPAVVKAPELIEAALAAGKNGPLHLQPRWLVVAAERQLELQKTAEARATAQQAKDLALKLQNEVNSHTPLGRSLQPQLSKISNALVAAEKVLAQAQ
jgi:hypothetical protein